MLEDPTHLRTLVSMSDEIQSSLDASRSAHSTLFPSSTTASTHTNSEANLGGVTTTGDGTQAASRSHSAQKSHGTHSTVSTPSSHIAQSTRDQSELAHTPTYSTTVQAVLPTETASETTSLLVFEPNGTQISSELTSDALPTQSLTDPEPQIQEPNWASRSPKTPVQSASLTIIFQCPNPSQLSSRAQERF